eukprot:scaffold21.g2212.t1
MAAAQQEAPQRQACIHFLNGTCRFGDRCNYSHDPAARRPLCTYFQRGFCSRGAACLYAHGEAEAAPPPAAPAPAPLPAAQPGGRPGARRPRQPLPPPRRVRQALNVFRDPTDQESEAQMHRESEIERELEALCGGGGSDSEEGESGGGARARRGRGAAREPRTAAQISRRVAELEAESEALADLHLRVTEEFLHLCWCAPCSRGFNCPNALLSHLKSKHASSEEIARLEAERACPCGREFESVKGLSSHVVAKHNSLTPGQRRADAMIKVLLARGPGLGMDGSGSEDGYGFDDGGMLGFTGDEGVKPWDDDAWEVMAYLNDPY